MGSTQLGSPIPMPPAGLVWKWAYSHEIWGVHGLSPHGIDGITPTPQVDSLRAVSPSVNWAELGIHVICLWLLCVSMHTVACIHSCNLWPLNIYKFLIDIFMNSHAMSYLHFQQTSRDGLYLRWLTWSMGFPKARPQRGEIWQMGQTVTLATLRESQKKWSWAHFYIYIIHA